MSAPVFPEVEEIWIVPENDPGSLTKTELKSTWVYRVEFAGVPYNIQAYGATDGTITVPNMGDELEIDGVPSGMFVTAVTPQRNNESPFFLDVYVVFSTLGDNPAQTGKWNTSIKVSGVKSTETTTRYYPTTANPAGKIIVNSAGDQYDPMQVRTLYDEKVSIGYTTDTVDGNTLATFRGKINSAAITMTVKGIARTFAIYTLKMDEISYGVEQTGATGVAPTFSNFNVGIDMIYRVDNWLPKLVDCGFRDINGVPFQDGQAAGVSPGGSKPVTAAVYMDGAGGQLLGAGSSGATTQPHMIIGGSLSTGGTDTLDGTIDFTPLLDRIE